MGDDARADRGPWGLRAWAEHLVHTSVLAEKLTPAPVEKDPWPARTSRVRLPDRPGRPVELRWTERLEDPLPSSARLADPSVRARLLHAFANHELQAIELMASALLRFDEAPPAFVRGLVGALGEEQRHLRGYLERLAALDVSFGAFEVSDFFWRAMSPMPDPLDFLAHMALTFEQANLDFARHYAGAFRAVGDPASAELLDTVLTDEIGHVKLGIVWFERWRERGPSLFEAHQRHLRAPHTPRRARGIGFDREARRRAGLPDDYIERLARFEASRGRPATLYVLDPHTEARALGGGDGKLDEAARSIRDDLETLPRFAASPQDFVWVGRAPDPAHEEKLAALGWASPRWVVRDRDGPLLAEHVPAERLAAVAPWGWSAPQRQAVSAWRERSLTPPPPLDADRLHAKTRWIDLRGDVCRALDDRGDTWVDLPEAWGAVRTDEASVLAEIRRLAAAGFDTSVVKAPHGTAGRHAMRVIGGRPSREQSAWLARTLSQQGSEVVVEPWLDRVCDLSFNFPGGASRATGRPRIGRFLCDRRGQVLASVLGPVMRNVPPTIARLLTGDGHDPRRLDRVADVLREHVVGRARQAGYDGPLGVDAMVFRTQDGALRFRPLVEVNLRPTLGSIAGALERRLVGSTRALWLVLPRARIGEGRSLADALRAASDRLPLDIHHGAAGPRVRAGVVTTTDPEAARIMLTVLLVGATQEAVLGALERLSASTATRIREAWSPH